MQSRNRVCLLMQAVRWGAPVVALLVAATLPMGCRTKSTIARQLVSPDQVVSVKAKQDLVNMGPAAVPTLLAAAEDTSDPKLREQALLTLGYVGHEGHAALEASRALAKYLIETFGREIPGRVAAVAALRMIGRPAIAPLSDVLAQTPVVIDDPQAPPKTLDIVAAMITIDRHGTIAALIKMLGEPQYRADVDNIVKHLRLITSENFGFDPNASAQAQDLAIRKWQDWWKQRGQFEGLL